MSKKRELDVPNPIEQAVRHAIYNSPVVIYQINDGGKKAVNYLYSTIEVLLPVPGGTKLVVLRRKIQADTATDQANEAVGAIRYFTNTLAFMVKGADEFEQEIFADDDTELNIVIGKSTFKIDRSRLKTDIQTMGDILATKGMITHLDFRTSADEPEEANA
jgi:hypothetical protein